MAPIPLAPSSADALLAAYERRAADAAPGSDGDWRRDHLGASLLGHDCDRYLWLTFRWAHDPQHSGRMLRLFDRGNREEAWIIDDLRAAGFQVLDREHKPECALRKWVDLLGQSEQDPPVCDCSDDFRGHQLRVAFGGGHVGGGLDGIVTGLLEAPAKPHVLEVKTHNKKQFEKLLADGCKRTKPMHWAQAQVYMRGRNLDRCYYIAVCKDDDRIYTERIHLDRQAADDLIAHGQLIVGMPRPPMRMDPSYPPCRYTTAEGATFDCDFHALCHGAAVPERNCRTCIESRPEPHDKDEEFDADSAWHCALHDAPITRLGQRAGCDKQLTIPEIHNADVVRGGVVTRTITYQRADGTQYTEGSPNNQPTEKTK
jgi:hypothetical protein